MKKSLRAVIIGNYAVKIVLDLLAKNHLSEVDIVSDQFDWDYVQDVVVERYDLLIIVPDYNPEKMKTVNNFWFKLTKSQKEKAMVYFYQEPCFADLFVRLYSSSLYLKRNFFYDDNNPKERRMIAVIRDVRKILGLTN